MRNILSGLWPVEPIIQPKKTQKERILEALERAGDKGVTNYQLNAICFRYGARLLELRHEGYVIKSKHEQGSLWRFLLVDDGA